MDTPDIQLVVQYKATCNLCTLWQQFGQAARGAEWEATTILIVEKKNTEEDHLLKAKLAAERKGKNKEGIRTGKRRKPTDKLPLPPSKRPALADQTPLINSDLDMMTVESSVPVELLKRDVLADVECTEDRRDRRIVATKYAGGNRTRKEAKKRNI